MTPDVDRIELPRFARDVSALRIGREAADDPRPASIPVSRPFSGVLGLAPWRSEWPRPAFSFLTLAQRFDSLLQDSGRTGRPVEEGDGRSQASDPDLDPDSDAAPSEDERRVREVLDASDTGSDGTMSGPMEPTPVAEQTTGTDVHDVDGPLGPSSAEPGPTRGPARAPKGDGDSGPPGGEIDSPGQQTSVSPPGADERSAGDAPGSDLFPGESSTERARRSPGTPDRPGGADGTTPWTLAPPAQAGAGDAGPPDDAGRRSLTTPAADQSVFEDRDDQERITGQVEMLFPELEGADPGSIGDIDPPAMEPLRVAAPAAQGTGPGDERSSPTTATGRPNGSRTAERAQTARSRPGEDQSAARARSDNGPPNDGSATERAPPGGTVRTPLDELVDVDRLADRLVHVFERKSRIERERRGR